MGGTTTMTLADAMQRAHDMLLGRTLSPDEALEIVKTLHGGRQFGIARKMLDRYAVDPRVMGDPATRRRVAQKRALSTYKDPDLATDLKLERALAILRETDDLDATKDQETLGLAGAIFKRQWELTGQERHLETSAAYYWRGYEQGVESDFGYTGINAAFVLDQLADAECPEGKLSSPSAESARVRRQGAAAMRRAIVDRVAPLEQDPDQATLRGTWWFLVTVGEAWFGLEQFDRAREWLVRAAALSDVPDWERESTARQLATLWRFARDAARREGREYGDPGEAVLREFLGNSEAALTSVVQGRIGVALSGGGFRASLYHIGVLAKLAELDLLRHVEYLSCVSGGSIIGAAYYLGVRALLEEKADRDITGDDYVRLVRRIGDEFLRGVERNLRTRIAAEWTTNLKMLLVSGYSRTKRAGELYETELFARIAPRIDWEKTSLADLTVQPKGEPAGFSPKDHNWRRSAKVPILMLNATSLNTGHNWQFTATWMGEPPAGIDTEIDANYRLRRMYYGDAPGTHRRVRVGDAVAASACVPGLFEPLSLSELYERRDDAGAPVRPIVRLVDGGVHDNQGVAALLEQGCSVLLVSDASGQMSSQDFPSTGLLGVPLRANSVLQARVRTAQFEDLEGRRRGGLLKGLMFVHLKKDLESMPVDWIDSQDPSILPRPDQLTSYGVDKGVQRRLAAIRTDLDSFSEAEAYALMTSAYLMTETALAAPIIGFPVPPAPRQTWTFLDIEPLMKEAGDSPLRRQLTVADKLFLKVWLLTRWLQLGAGLAVLTLLVLLGFAVHGSWRSEFSVSISVASIVLAIGTVALSLAGLGIVSKLINYRKTVQDVLIGLGMVTVGFAVARLHLHVFDRIFLAQGRLARLLRKEAAVTSVSVSAPPPAEKGMDGVTL
jgi:predicted acylesterase/phospholipase RssA